MILLLVILSIYVYIYGITAYQSLLCYFLLNNKLPFFWLKATYYEINRSIDQEKNTDISQLIKY